jgi:hypothetical protein
MSDVEIMRQIQEAYTKRQLEEELGDLDATLNEKLMNIQRDATGKFLPSFGATLLPDTFEEVEPGWYQDKKGDLFFYDGIVWDIVPTVKISDLEYLGS